MVISFDDVVFDDGIDSYDGDCHGDYHDDSHGDFHDSFLREHGCQQIHCDVLQENKNKKKFCE